MATGPLMQRRARGHARIPREALLLLASAGVVTGPGLLRAQAQARIAVVSPDRPIDSGVNPMPLVEPHVAVDPAHPNRLVVGVIVPAPEASGPWVCAALASGDGGASWTRTELAVHRCIDPWVVFTRDGVLLTAIEILEDGEGGERFHLVRFRSQDGGLTWSGPESIGRSFDHQVITAGGDGRNVLYMAARRMRETRSGAPRHTVYVGVSADGGRQFQQVDELWPSNLALNATGILPMSAGTVLVSYWDHQRNVDGFDREGMLQQGRAWAIRLDPATGVSSEPLLITDRCASGIEGAFPGYPALAAGLDVRGSVIHHACVLPGLDGIGVTSSRDGGETWTDPVRLAPVPEGAGHARTPMLAATADGTLGVAWYDRSGSFDVTCQHTYFAASIDGGETFLPSVRVSTEPSCPEGPGNGRVARSWAAGGDYGSLAASPDGTFRLVWADSRSGTFRLRQAVLRVDPASRP